MNTKKIVRRNVMINYNTSNY